MDRTPRNSAISAALRFTLPGIIGILGISALHAVNVDLLELVIGLFLLFYGLFFMARATLPTVKGYYPFIDMTFGLIGGFLGGLGRFIRCFAHILAFA